MTDWPGLPAEDVSRPLPVNLVPEDRPLFGHEERKSFGPTVPRLGAWDFTEEGLLLKPRSAFVDPLSFQGAFPPGLAGIKVSAKGVLALSQPRQPLAGGTGALPLVVTDEFSNGYFHWIAEALPKLWWVRHRLEAVTLVLPAFARRYRYMVESLALWPQLKTVMIPGRTRTVLDQAVVVPSLAPTGNYRPSLVAGLAADWRAKLQTSPPWRRLYISRAKAPWRKIHNEDAVWAELQQRGFERVWLEDLAFADQVRLLAETQTLVSNHGAGLTNLLFMVPGTQVVEVRLRGDANNNCYFSLAGAVGVSYSYLLADPVAGATDSHTADLIVDPRALGRILEDLG